MSRLTTEDWIVKRMEAIKRDKACRNCGSKENLDVHHLIPYSKIRHNHLWNLVSLCGRCHKESENWYIRIGLTSKMLLWIDQNVQKTRIELL